MVLLFLWLLASPFPLPFIFTTPLPSNLVPTHDPFVSPAFLSPFDLLSFLRFGLSEKDLQLLRFKRPASSVISNTNNSTIDLMAGDIPFSPERSFSTFWSATSMSILFIVNGSCLYNEPLIYLLRLL